MATLQDLSVCSHCLEQRTSYFALVSWGTTTPHPGTQNSIIHSRYHITPFVSKSRCALISEDCNIGSGFHRQLRGTNRGMSSIGEAEGLRPPPQQSHPSPRIALQRSLAKSDQPSNLSSAPSCSSLDQYLADIPPPLRTKKSASSFSSNQDGGDSREPAHHQSQGEQFLPPATAIGSSASSEDKLNVSKSVSMAYQQDPAPDWILHFPTFLEPKTYRASATETMLARPRLKDLQPHASSDLSVEVTQIQQLELEIEETPWLPIQKPETESPLLKGSKSAEWHAKDCEYSVLTPSMALPTPKGCFPSSKSEIHPDDECLACHSGSASLKDCPVSSPSYDVSSNCTRDILYDGPSQNSDARKSGAKVTQLGEKQPKEQIARIFPAASSGSSTERSSSRLKSHNSQGPINPPYGPGNVYDNLLSLAQNSRPTYSNNPYPYSGSEFSASNLNTPSKAKQLLGIHPESQSPARRNLPLRPQTKPGIPFLSKFSKRKTGDNVMLTQDTPSVQTNKKSTSLRKIISMPFKPADGKGKRPPN